MKNLWEDGVYYFVNSMIEENKYFTDIMEEIF